MSVGNREGREKDRLVPKAMGIWPNVAVPAECARLPGWWPPLLSLALRGAPVPIVTTQVQP